MYLVGFTGASFFCEARIRVDPARTSLLLIRCARRLGVGRATERQSLPAAKLFNEEPQRFLVVAGVAPRQV